MYDFSICVMCMSGTKISGKMMCASCFQGMRNDLAAKVRVELARGQRNRVTPTRIIQRGRLHTPPVKAREIVRKWWEVSYVGPEGVRITKKYGQAKLAVTKYVEFRADKAEGLTLAEMRNGARTQLLPEIAPKGTP